MTLERIFSTTFTVLGVKILLKTGKCSMKLNFLVLGDILTPKTVNVVEKMLSRVIHMLPGNLKCLKMKTSRNLDHLLYGALNPISAKI